MSVDPDLRIALGFMLLLRCAVAFTYSDALSEFGIFAQLRHNSVRRVWVERIVWILLTLPILVFLWDTNSFGRIAHALSPASADFATMQLPVGFRWLLLIPATMGLLLQLWTRSAACPASVSGTAVAAGESRGPVASAVPLTTSCLGSAGGPSQIDGSKPENSSTLESQPTDVDGSARQRWVRGPFRVVRFPFWTADLICFASLLAATDSFASLIAFLGAAVLLRWFALPGAEEAWKRLLGDDYNAYRSSTGVLLPNRPRRASGAAPQYFVPKQFGLPAVIALVTMFAVMFGVLNAFQRWLTEVPFTPVVHLYFGLLLMLVWVAQMRFERSARFASLLVGAVLLPVFVAFSVDRWPSNVTIMVSGVGLVILGGIIGYCMGAMAAGLFLMADWLGPYLPSSRKREQNPSFNGKP